MNTDSHDTPAPAEQPDLSLLPPIPQQAPINRPPLPREPQKEHRNHLILPNYNWGPFTALQSIILRAFDFKGRAARKELWLSIVGCIITFMSIVIGAAIVTLLFRECPWIHNTTYNILRHILIYTLFIPYIAVIVRRFHDSGVNNWGIGVFFSLVAAPIIMMLSEDDKLSFEAKVYATLFYLVLGIIFIIFMCRRSSALKNARPYGDGPYPPADPDEDGNAFTRILARGFTPKWIVIIISCSMLLSGLVAYTFDKQEWGLSQEIGYRMLALTHATDGFGPKKNKWFDIGENDFDMGHPLHSAIRRGHTKGVKILLGAVDVNQTDSDGNTPLHIAAKEGNEEIVKLLLETEGIEAHERNWNGNTPADVATEECRELIVKSAGEPPSRSRSYYNYYWGY